MNQMTDVATAAVAAVNNGPYDEVLSWAELDALEDAADEAWLQSLLVQAAPAEFEAEFWANIDEGPAGEAVAEVAIEAWYEAALEAQRANQARWEAESMFFGHSAGVEIARENGTLDPQWDIDADRIKAERQAKAAKYFDLESDLTVD